MKKYKISVMEKGYVIKENYIMAEDENDAHDSFFCNVKKLLNPEWKIVKSKMKENVEIKEIKPYE